MPFEIERKFLVASDTWRRGVTRSISIRDGLLATGEGSKVRVRITGEGASLTIKGPRAGLRRAEFEYPIPLDDARELLADHSLGPAVEKTRHLVPHGDHVWEVDVYEGLLAGLVVAEIELSREDEAFQRPAWIGEEVTGEERYSKIALVRAALEASRKVTGEEPGP